MNRFVPSCASRQCLRKRFSGACWMFRVVREVLVGASIIFLPGFNLSAQLVPVDVRTMVNGFQDDFDGTALGPNWVVSGSSVFSVGNSLLHVTSASGNPNHLLYELPGYSNTVQEVLARIRIMNFGTGDAARAGVGVGVDPVSSQGINYLFRNGSSESQTGYHTAFLDDSRAWGPGQNFTWQTNVWYWMRLRQESNSVPQGGTNDVFAKIWLADGSVAEPASWQLVWDYTPGRTTRAGYAGVTASSASGIAEFDVDYILIKAAGLPSILVAPSAFVLTPAAITNQPQSQSVAELSPVAFSVGATGNPAPAYQWYKGTTAISGALNASYAIPSASYADNGAQFRVVVQNTVSNVNYSVTSGVATLTVTADVVAPTVSEMIPAAGSVVPALAEIEVHFSEGVQGVDAGDLLIDGAPATNVTVIAPDVYVFDFPQPTNGPVQVTWSPAHGIADLAFHSNPFAGGTCTYTLDPSAVTSDVFISEFMASNKHTLHDEDGNASDWIEIYNRSSGPMDLSGWYLTDNASKLTKWRFPNGVTLLSKSYLLVWASGNDRTNPAAPLHTNFKLDKAAGNFLGLAYSNGISVVSAFANYPQQYDDVSYGRDRLNPSLVGYFTNATPGAANSTVGPGFGPAVQFSVASCTFQQPFTLTLSMTGSNAVIRYFLVTNGTTAAMTGVPDTNSPIYTAPLTITNSIQIRARAFPTQTNYFPGPPHSEAYFQLGSDVVNFSSDLPIVIFHDMGQGAVAATTDQFMTMQVFDTENGRSALTNPPDLAVQGIFHRRGQATFWNPKTNLRVETQDEFGDNLNVPVAGFPAENDWVFYGIDCFDKVLMHNPLTHELYRELGHYSSRARYVEVYLKDDSGAPGPITAADYNGLYVLEEKIKIGKNRVDIDKLEPENTNAPSVTGGYLLSIDKSNPGSAMSVANASIWNLDPDYYTITACPTQQQYIYNDFNSFYTALNGLNWTNPVTGYAPYIDMSSWIDYHLQQTLVFNVDALRISAYFYKPRNGPIVQGPLWDFDRAFADSSDDRGFNPRRWKSGSGDGGTDMFNPGGTFNNPWYSKLFTDPDFWQRWIDRYQALRKTTYSSSNLMAQIDYFGNQVREATTREYPRWAGSGGSDTTPRSGAHTGDGLTYTFPTPGTWQGEIEFTKYWFSNRVDFMDTNFLNPPSFSSGGGAITQGFPLNITAATREANSTIYYTLNGTDPRLPGGGVSPTALSSLNAATITLTTNARVFARNFNAAHNNLTGTNNPPLSSHWSGPTVATFVVGTPPLRITEIMFNPLAPPPGNTNDNDNFEFIELQNISAAPLNLAGFHLTGGIEFVFPSMILGAGQSVVVVENLAAFQSRYGTSILVAGVYARNLSNSGDEIILQGPLQEPILDFSYDGSCCPTADGLGFSLVIRDPTAPLSTWCLEQSWRPSSAIGGSPGQTDPPPPAIPSILVNEALAHTDPPQEDTIELFNPTAGWVNIGGWLLTDDRHDPIKYRIPDGTLIAPGGYLTFGSNQFGVGPKAFELSSVGEEAYLFSADANTNLTGYSHGFKFGASPNGVAFGRYVNSKGDEQFVLESRNTLGTNNAYPRVGPVIVSEIMYHPPDLPGGVNDDLNEFIELHNIMATNVPLYDVNAPSNTWQLANAVDFAFPTNVVLAAGGRLLAVAFDPVHNTAQLAVFVAKYHVPANIPMYGPWSGKLNNSGEKVELQRPDTPNVTPTNIYAPYYLVEAVAYSPTAPWPTSADGGGASLQRIEPTLFANDPINWQAAAPTAGQTNPPGPAVDVDADGMPDVWELANGLDPQVNDANLDPDHDGMSNIQEYLAGTDPHNALDFLHFNRAYVSGTNCVLEFNTHVGRTYAVEMRDSLSPTNAWRSFSNNIPGTGGAISISDPLGPTAGFFRLNATFSQ